MTQDSSVTDCSVTCGDAALSEAAGRDAPRCSDWFLTSEERGNPNTSIDSRHAGEAWTSGNLVAVLSHGRHYFARLHEVLLQTRPDDLVLFTDWRGDPDERLNGPGTEVAEVLATIASRGVRVRGLLWRSHPDRTGFNERENRDLAMMIDAAGGVVSLDERVRRAGSHHQKLIVILHPGQPQADVAFVGGIDLCHGRNDDAEHLGDRQSVSIDPRFGATPAWHDMQVEVRGPAVDDLAETFRERWNDQHPLTRSNWHRRGRSSRSGPPRIESSVVDRGAAPCGPHHVQVLRTYPAKRPAYPFARGGERSIARAYLKALRRARRLVYIEDQYFWSLDMSRALVRALHEQPTLKIVVVVPKFPDEDGRFSGPPNRIGQLAAIHDLREFGRHRFAIYDLEKDRLPIYVHAKICIIDDVWMTVGSDNLNRRSWTHDSELSCAVLDSTPDLRQPEDPGGLGDGARLLARTTRLALWTEHLEASDDLPVDLDQGFALLRASAETLDRWHATGRTVPRPTGRLREHVPQPVRPYESVPARLMYRLVNDPDGRPIRKRISRSY